nr:immunoglobulin heavy chain junction region [Homo sapiens]
ANEQPESRGH